MNICLLLTLPASQEVRGIRIDLDVAILALVLGLAALYYAIVQKNEMSRALKNLSGVSGDLKKTQQMVDDTLKQTSTRFVGKFPTSISALNNLLARCEGSVQIMVDFVGYCVYSEPEAFDVYMTHLKRISRLPDATIEMIVYDETRWNEAIDLQFGGANFDAEKKKDSWNRYWQRRRYSSECKVPPDYKTFVEFLRKKDNAAMEELKSEGIQVIEASARFSFFSWITGNGEAIVSFEDTTGVEHQVAFYTYDPHLVGVFSEMFTKAKEDAAKRQVTVASRTLLNTEDPGTQTETSHDALQAPLTRVQ